MLGRDKSVGALIRDQVLGLGEFLSNNRGLSAFFGVGKSEADASESDAGDENAAERITDSESSESISDVAPENLDSFKGLGGAAEFAPSLDAGDLGEDGPEFSEQLAEATARSTPHCNPLFSTQAGIRRARQARL